MGEKYLSEVIDYEKDIKPHPFVEIVSGVGSGKNYFIDQFLQHKCISKDAPQTILLITSRRAKVDEILDKDDVSRLGKIDKWRKYHWISRKEVPEDQTVFVKDKKWLRVVHQESVVCTYAFIEAYMKYIHVGSDPTTHLWRLFDMIVVDEAHALVSDASYQSAPFYVQELINECIKFQCSEESIEHEYFEGRYGVKHILLMTGTPELLDSSMFMRKPYVIDKRDECIMVVPRNICFLRQNKVLGMLQEQLEADEKIIYFTNSINSLNKMVNVLQARGIPRDVMAKSYSSEEKRSLETPEDLERMRAVEEALITKQRIPDDIQLLVTTGKNKEGINIGNKDIKHVYVETNDFIDIVQMAGRVRHGVENMFIVIDKPQLTSRLSGFDRAFVKSMMFKNKFQNIFNDYFEGICNREGDQNFFEFHNTDTRVVDHEKRVEFVEYVHEHYPFVRYSYCSNSFRYYELKDYSIRIQKNNASFDSEKEDHLEHFLEILQSFYNFNGCKTHIHKESFYEVMLNKLPEKEQEISRRTQEAIQFLEKNYVVGELYTPAERRTAFAELCGILGNERKLEVSAINNSILKSKMKCDYRFEAKNKKTPKDDDDPFYRFVKKT